MGCSLPRVFRELDVGESNEHFGGAVSQKSAGGPRELTFVQEFGAGVRGRGMAQPPYFPSENPNNSWHGSAILLDGAWNGPSWGGLPASCLISKSIIRSAVGGRIHRVSSFNCAGLAATVRA